MKHVIKIAHLYSDLMNIYGDRGNILTVLKRCEWREIGTEIEEISISQPIKPNMHDLYFFGGGQDQEQLIVSQDLKGDKGKVIIEDVNQGAAMLAICGGYQLLGKYYHPVKGEDMPGIGLFPIKTIAGSKRMIGNVVVQLSSNFQQLIKDVYPKTKHADLKLLVGFENHSGKTFVDANPLGKVIVGNGNNGEDLSEGCVLKNAIGCYLHGSLLPKNPHLADFLIASALKHRYKENISLKPLDDRSEWKAHSDAIKRSHNLSLR